MLRKAWKGEMEHEKTGKGKPLGAERSPPHVFRELFLTSHAHSCDMGIRPTWVGRAFWNPKHAAPRAHQTMWEAVLEVTVHLAVRAHIREPWKSELDVDRSIALPSSVWPWLGRELRLRGSLVIRGGAESEGADLNFSGGQIWVKKPETGRGIHRERNKVEIPSDLRPALESRARGDRCAAGGVRCGLAALSGGPVIPLVC